MIKRLLTTLIQKANQEVISPEMEQQVDTWLDENDLDTEDRIPQWFTDLLLCLTEQRTCEKTYFESHKSEGDIFNLLAELESVLTADWDDYGEDMKIYFPNLKLEVYISLEGSFYFVS